MSVDELVSALRAPDGLGAIAIVLLAWIVTYAVHSTLLLGGAWLVTRRFPSGWMAVRERIWKYALLGALATASVQVGLGLEPLGGRVALPPLLSSSAPVESEVAQAPRFAPIPVFVPTFDADTIEASEPEFTPMVQPASTAPKQMSASPLTWPALATLQWAEQLANEPAVSSVAPRTELAPEPSAQLAWTSWALFAGSTGALAGLVLFVLLWVRLTKRLKQREPLTTGPLPALLADLCRRGGVRRKVRLSVAPGLGAPISMGILRPEICLSTRALFELDLEEQEALLAHELAHIARRDPLWLCVAHLCEGVLFFQPLNRVARREIEDCAEFLSDAWAVRHTGLRLSLASCLTRIAEWIVGDRRVLPAPAMAHGRSRLAQRVERLLDERAGEVGAKRHAWLEPVCASFAAGLVLIVPAVSAATDDDSARGDCKTECAAECESECESEPCPPCEPCPEKEDCETECEEKGSDAKCDAAADSTYAVELRGELAELDAEIEELAAGFAELGQTAADLGLAERIAGEIEQLEMALQRLRLQRARLESRLPSATPPPAPDCKGAPTELPPSVLSLIRSETTR